MKTPLAAARCSISAYRAVDFHLSSQTPTLFRFLNLELSKSFPADVASPFRILLVDENEETRSEIVALLQPHAHVSAVVSTQAALNTFSHDLPDLILCDEHNGPLLLQQIRANAAWRDLIVILLTDSAVPPPLPGRLDILADDYLPVPCPALHLLARVQTHLRHLRRVRDREERLRENEALLQSLIVSATDCLAILDLDGHLLWMSESGQRLMDIGDFSTWRLCPWPDLWQRPEDHLAAGNALRSARRRSLSHFRAQRPTPSGKPRWWEVSVTPILDQAGQPGGILCVSRDITATVQARESLRKSESRWRQLTEAIPQLVWSCTADASVTFFNARWDAYTGIPSGQRIGQPWFALAHPEDIGRLQSSWEQAAAATAPFTAELRLQNREGEYRWFAASVLPGNASPGHVAQWYGSATDIEDFKRVEMALRENEVRLTAIFQQAGAGIVQADAQGRYLLVNDAYCEITGRSREELLQLTMRDTTYPDDVAASTPPFEALFRGGPPFIIEKRYLRPDGSSVWARKSIVGLRDLHGRTFAALAIVQDITESRLAEEELLDREAQLRLVTDNAPVLLAQIDRDYHYKFVNRPYAARYGWEPRQIIGRHIAEIVGSPAFETALPYMQQALDGQQVEFEIELAYLHAHLGRRWGHVIYVPERSPEGEIVGFLAVLTDITLRKQAERELEQARDEALAASRAKDDFLARLSHELRTPLSPALLIASEAASDLSLPADVRANFETIRKNVDLEARLIDDLLDLTRITRGKLVLETRPLRIQQVIEDALHTVHAEAQQKGLTFHLQLTTPDSVVYGDAIRLQQVLWNVLKNAIKFSPEGVAITVVTSVHQHTHMTQITDSGIGLTHLELKNVFQAFSQGQHTQHPHRHHFGGLGLGLAISRMLVQQHAGRIHAESPGRNRGATFTIELPLANVAAETSPPPVTDAIKRPVLPNNTPSSELRILLVEDHEATRHAMALLLTRRKHHVTAVGTVAAALEAARHHIFDLVISDIGLPDASGYELMSALRDQCGIPGIALTGYGMEQDIARSQAAGFHTHLTKPVRAQRLEAAIHHTLQGLRAK